jgi:hypothetical protein
MIATLTVSPRSNAYCLALSRRYELHLHESQEVPNAAHQHRLQALQQARALREHLAKQGRHTDSIRALDEVRKDRLDELSNCVDATSRGSTV